jgi:hypothetical protein
MALGFCDQTIPKLRHGQLSKPKFIPSSTKVRYADKADVCNASLLWQAWAGCVHNAQGSKMSISKFFRKKKPPYEIRDNEHGVGKVFILCAPWRDAYADLMTSEDIRAIRLPDKGFGFDAQPIDFIADLNFLKSVEIYTYDITDLTPLTNLENIEVLGLQVKSAAGIKGWRPPLRVLLASWRQQLEPMLSIESLEYVNISNYPFVDLQALATPRLRRLSLASRKLATLSGSADLPLLETVDLYNCPNLKSVEELFSAHSMKTLSVAACRHISQTQKTTHFNE